MSLSESDKRLKCEILTDTDRKCQILGSSIQRFLTC